VSATNYLIAEQKQQFIRDGYVVVSGLIPQEIVISTREALLAATGMRQEDPDTWKRSATVLFDLYQLTLPCWTEALVDCATELTGRDILRDSVFSPYREQRGLSPHMSGYVPVLNYPVPGPPQFDRPTGAHVDGLHRVRLYPETQYLVVFAYLTDVSPYGGATAVWPGSHRRLFEYHFARGVKPGDAIPDTKFDFELGEAQPFVGSAGDVILMHYLLVHSGSTNHSDQIRIGLNSAINPDPSLPYVPKTGSPQPNWTPIDWTLRIDNLETVASVNNP